MMHVSECIFHIDHFIIIARDFYNISVSDDWNVTHHLSHEKKLGFLLLGYVPKLAILNTYLSLHMQDLSIGKHAQKFD